MIKNISGFFARKLKKPELEDAPVELAQTDLEFIAMIKRKKWSMVSDQRLYATMMACKHVAHNDIPGDFVECGVWRGGNALIAAWVFGQYAPSKKIWLFDTFLGMTEPSEADTRLTTGKLAIKTYESRAKGDYNDWCYASLDAVRENFDHCGLLGENIRFVPGDVIETLGNDCNVPKKISLLRLDTDWYESTRKELEVLYPRLVHGGIIIIDDYGYWAGSKRATDEYFEKAGNRPFLQYVDSDGRMGIKISEGL